jgi:hypothetical protein
MQLQISIPIWEQKDGKLTSTFVFSGQQYTCYLNKVDSEKENAPKYSIVVRSYEPRRKD